jgi:glutamine amidotransferase
VIAMIDMEMGNLQSVLEACERVGVRVQVTTKARDIEMADAVILPGVGAFGDGMAALRKQGLVDGLHRHAVRKKKPLLGICLGMQLLAEVGEEHGVHEGLGYVKGHVVRLNATEAGCRVPNMGWCDVTVVKPGGLFEGVRDGESFYFAHSYYLECADRQDIAATIQYSGRAIPAAIERENLLGVQFHPEKSQDVGLEVLDSFFRYLGCRASA